MSDLTPRTSAFTLREVPARDEVIRIDAEGFHYLGQFIADAGEAYQLLVEFLRKQRQAPVPVSEQLPVPEDCDAEGRVWLYRPQTPILNPYWDLVKLDYIDPVPPTHWLPAHALSLPEVGNG